ncbi:MAG: asparagine synthase C-terminal domain-containing protein, partial [Bacteroidales bacterium]|nr:asparagine synthase C-terminal domain-containing protein [Bacteroidales bacterium]
ADVPVGAYLSGGIDSSITTAYIREIFPDNLRTFSIGFKDKEFDESEYQRLVIDHLNTKHSGIKCSSEEIADIYPQIIWHTEIPLLRTSPAPMFFLSESVRKNNFKVVITGEGADEMFAGYNIFKEMTIRRFWAREPSSRIRPLLLKKLYPYIPQLTQNPGVLKLFFGYRLTETDSPFYSHLLRWQNTSRLTALFSDSIKRELKDYDPVEELSGLLPGQFSRWSSLAKAQWLEINIFMSEYLLSSQGDRMAMANSVEGRYPFLDHRIIEFAAQLPPDLKLHGLTEKFILKKMMKGRLPDTIVNRPKQAYRAPITSTFVKNKPEYFHNILSEEHIREAGIFNPENIARLLKKLEDSPASSEMDNMALTGIISTQLLDKLFIRNKKKLTEQIPENCIIITDTE